MQLLTTPLRLKLIDNGRRQALVAGTDAEHDFFPVVKLFDPCSAATWLLTEIDPEDPTIAFGLCDLGHECPEIGSVSLTELAAFRGRIGLGIERDLQFKARARLSTYADKARRAGCIVEHWDD